MVRIDQPFGRPVSLAKFGTVEEKGQRSGQIRFQRHPLIGQQDLIGSERVKELQHAGAGLAGAGTIVGLDASHQRGDGVAEPLGVVLFTFVRRRLWGGVPRSAARPAHRSCGDCEAFDLVIADKLVMVKLIRPPLSAHLGSNDKFSFRRFDRVGLAGFDLLVAAEKTQRVLERFVVQVADGTKLRIVGIASRLQVIAE